MDHSWVYRIQRLANCYADLDRDYTSAVACNRWKVRFIAYSRCAPIAGLCDNTSSTLDNLHIHGQRYGRGTGRLGTGKIRFRLDDRRIKAFWTLGRGDLLAGLLALYQLHRKNSFELTLEQQKREVELKNRDLQAMRELADRERHRASEFRIDRFQPFMNALNRTMIHSYSAALAPQAYSEIIGHVPILRRFEDQSLREWMHALEEMSDLRMQVVLSIDRIDVAQFIGILQEHTKLGLDLIEERNNFYRQRSSIGKIAEIHRAYIAKGFELMLAVKDALFRDPAETAPLTKDERDAMARELALPFERASHVSVPYGTASSCAWVGLWVSNADIASYELGNDGLNKLDEHLRQLAVAFYKDLQSGLDVKMVRLGAPKDGNSDEIRWLLSVVFGMQKDLNAFVDEILPSVKKQLPKIWVGFLAPTEFVVNVPSRKDRGD